MKLKAGEELVKYITEQAVNYIGTPKAERKSHSSKGAQQWSSRWFGMIPVAVKMWLDMKRKRVRKQ